MRESGYELQYSEMRFLVSITDSISIEIGNNRF
jgi:hypothetical protein